MAFKGMAQVRVERREKALAMLAAGEKVPFAMRGLVKDELAAHAAQAGASSEAEKPGEAIALELASEPDLTDEDHPVPDDKSISAGGPNGPELFHYKVIYRGGLPEYPDKKVSGIILAVHSGVFALRPTMGSKGWFRGLTIPYERVIGVTLEQRIVGTGQALLGGLNSRQLNQANNIHIEFLASSPEPLVVRLEMISGVTVMGQAAKCREFEDRLRTNGIHAKFGRQRGSTQTTVPTADSDPLAQLERLAALKERGLVTDEEFSAKKAALLDRI